MRIYRNDFETSRIYRSQDSLFVSFEGFPGRGESMEPDFELSRNWNYKLLLSKHRTKITYLELF